MILNMLNAFVYVRSDPYRTRGRINRNVHVITISFHPLRNFIVSFASLWTKTTFNTLSKNF